jgi:hypothetical protein
LRRARWVTWTPCCAAHSRRRRRAQRCCEHDTARAILTRRLARRPRPRRRRPSPSPPACPRSRHGQRRTASAACLRWQRLMCRVTVRSAESQTARRVHRLRRQREAGARTTSSLRSCVLAVSQARLNHAHGQAMSSNLYLNLILGAPARLLCAMPQPLASADAVCNARRHLRDCRHRQGNGHLAAVSANTSCWRLSAGGCCRFAGVARCVVKNKKCY